MVPKISVLMSVHNGATHLQTALDSIFNQTFSDFELIVIDDTSTDTTSTILKSYSDPRLKIITNSVNFGLTKSLNIGLKQARGRYLVRLDADDIALPHRLTTQYAFMESNPDLVLSGSAAELINDRGQTVGLKRKPVALAVIKFRILTSNPFLHPSLIMKTESILNLGGYNEKFSYAQDYELTSRLFARGFKLANLPEPLIRYRLSGSSLTNQPATRALQLAAAQTVSHANLNRLLPVSLSETKILINALYHQPPPLSSCLTALLLYRRLTACFLKQEKLSSASIHLIKHLSRSDQKTILTRWLKNRLGKS